MTTKLSESSFGNAEPFVCPRCGNKPLDAAHVGFSKDFKNLVCCKCGEIVA